MKKHLKVLGRLVKVSTYVIIFCVIGNMAMPALIVQNVQALSESSTSSISEVTESKLTQSQKKDIDKLQAEAKASLYKEMKFTKSEIAFLDSHDMATINQKVDKYVVYDKTGIASFNANGYRTDRTILLSKSNTEIVISISNKMILNYNTDLKKPITNIIDSKDSVKNSASINSSNLSAPTITREINSRGYMMNVKFNQNSTNVTASFINGSCKPSLNYYNFQRTWWGYISATVSLNSCAIDFIKDSSDGWLWLVGTASTACSLVSFGSCAVIGFAIGAFVGGVSWSLYYTNKWYCNSNGVAVKLKAYEYILNSSPLKALVYYQCN